jgi:hypothetical protein
MARVLVDHVEIRQWAEARAGNPMMMDAVPDGTHMGNPLLQITFGQHALNADHNEGPDPATGGQNLVGWDEWLAELDRQGLAIKVRDDQPGRLDNDFEFVSRDGEGETTDAARKPAV